MKKTIMLGTVLTCTLAATAFADPPKTLHVVKSVVIHAPADKVWGAVKDFDSLDKWHPGFVKDEIVKGKNNTPGAVRSITVKDGPTFTEQLLAFDEANHSYRYRIVESPLPVQHYVSRIAVKSGPNDTTRVTWSGSFKRKNESDNPPEAENDAAVKKLVTGVYEGGLQGLKKKAEGGS